METSVASAAAPPTRWAQRALASRVTPPRAALARPGQHGAQSTPAPGRPATRTARASWACAIAWTAGRATRATRAAPRASAGAISEYAHPEAAKHVNHGICGLFTLVCE